MYKEQEYRVQSTYGFDTRGAKGGNGGGGGGTNKEGSDSKGFKGHETTVAGVAFSINGNRPG